MEAPSPKEEKAMIQTEEKNVIKTNIKLTTVDPRNIAKEIKKSVAAPQMKSDSQPNKEEKKPVDTKNIQM